MARPKFAMVPKAEELAALEPDKRVDAITAIAVSLRTLPKPHADLRKESLRGMLAAGWTNAKLAERFGLSRGGVSHLTGPARAAASEGAPS